MVFHARPVSAKPTWLNGLAARLIAGLSEANYGDALRRLGTLRAELAAIQKLRERGIDAVTRDQRIECSRPFWF